jgi:hypothetical protein
MSRLGKKFGYGFIYLLIFGLIGGGVYLRFFSPDPASCVDGILNQEETEIDCGGSCQSCELKSLSLEIGKVEIVEVGNTATFLVSFENPSSNYGAIDVPYTFSYSDDNNLPKNIDGKFSVDPAEIGYISETGIKLDSAGSVFFDLGDFEFIESKDIPVYQIGIRDLSIEFPESQVEISGLVINDSPTDIETLKLLVLLKDTNDRVVNAAQTLIDDISAFNRKDFIVVIPRNNEFIDSARTELIWEVID